MGTDYKAQIDGKDYTPQELSALILRKLKEGGKHILVRRLPRR